MPQDLGYILVQRRDGGIRHVAVTGELVRIGRENDRDLVLPDATVSGRHAVLSIRPDGVLLTDEKSTNGTFIANRKAPPFQPMPLALGESFRIGPFLLTYVPPGALESSAQAGDIAVPSGAYPDDSEEIPQPPKMRTVVRNRYPMQEPAPGVSAFMDYLPIIFHEEPFMGRFLQIFEALWEPLEQRQDHIDMYFDPYTCPDSFLPWMAGWLDLAFNQSWPEPRRRRLLANAMELYRWRGTPEGLRRIIEVCTELSPIIREDPSQPYIFDVTITIPRDSDITPRFIEELLKTHKPAYAGYTLEVR